MLWHPWVQFNTRKGDIAAALALAVPTGGAEAVAGGAPLVQPAPGVAAVPAAAAVQAAVAPVAAAAVVAAGGKPFAKAKKEDQASSSPRGDGIPAYVPPRSQEVGRTASVTAANIASGHSSSSCTSSVTGSVAGSMVSLADSAASMHQEGRGGGGIGSKGSKHVVRQATIEEGLAEAEQAEAQAAAAAAAAAAQGKEKSASRLGRWMCLFNASAAARGSDS